MFASTIKSSPSKRIGSRGIRPSLGGACYPSRCRVDVDFAEDLSPEQIRANIGQLSNPQIVVWYIGCYGLKKAGMQFYKDFLISPLFSQNTKATFWLVDLTAWGAFKNPQCSIYNFNSCCKDLENFSDGQIKCIKSSAIFRKMQEISETDVLDYFKKGTEPTIYL